jgi:hypothetical protein
MKVLNKKQKFRIEIVPELIFHVVIVVFVKEIIIKVVQESLDFIVLLFLLIGKLQITTLSSVLPKRVNV